MIKIFDNLEDAFRELDIGEFAFLAKILADYKQSLMKEGFTRVEAMKLVETFAQFLYNITMEDFSSTKRTEELHTEAELFEDDVDSDDDSEDDY